METIPDAAPRVHVLVCVNDRTGTGDPLPCCAAHLARPQVRELKKWLLEEGLAPALQLTATYCLGHCHATGATAAGYPEGRVVRGIRGPEDLRALLLAEAKKAGLR